MKSAPHLPLIELLHPHEQTRAVVVVAVVGLIAWSVVVFAAGWPIWGATTLMLALLLIPGVQKWRADRRRFGVTGMVLSIIVAMQGFHSIEHLVQWIQYHILHWPPWVSAGLISAANAEWVHFVWNWGVLLVVVYLIRGGMRSPWAWLLLLWTAAHTLEHSYMMVRYLEMRRELAQLGFPQVSAQGLPGILGRDGWLARSPATQGTFLCRVPALTTAIRLDVHFWWNTGETLLLLAAAHAFLRRHLFAREGKIG